MAGQYWDLPLYAPHTTAAFVAVASTASITDLTLETAAATGMPVQIPANFMQRGSAIRFRANGIFSNTGTPTAIFTLCWGGAAGVALATSPTITTITAATNWPWIWEGIITCRATGSGTIGQMWTQGSILMPATVNTFQAAYSASTAAPAVVGVDTTTAKSLTLAVTWSASSASNTMTLEHLICESVI